MVSSWQHSKEYVTYIFKISSYTASRLTPEPFIVDWYPFVDLTYIQYEVNKYWNTAIKLPLRSSFLAHCFFRQRMYPIFQSFSYIWLLPSRILWSTINYMHSICMWYNAPTMLPAVGIYINDERSSKYQVFLILLKNDFWTAKTYTSSIWIFTVGVAVKFLRKCRH